MRVPIIIKSYHQSNRIIKYFIKSLMYIHYNYEYLDLITRRYEDSLVDILK